MIKAFGIIPIQEEKVLMVHHKKGHWAFPKGHPNEGEEPKETASRELMEETGLKVVEFLDHPPLQEHYDAYGKPKEVTYFLAKVEGELHLQEEEICDAAWVTPHEAEQLASFDECKALCTQSLMFLKC